MTIMTPEEVLKYGKRVVLFPQKGSKARLTYYVDGSRLVRQNVMWSNGVQIDIIHSPIEIKEIYHLIERVYSQKKKGILIARRSGNRESNKKRLLPLNKTGKGMGAMITKPKPIDIYTQLDFVEKKVQENTQRAFKKEKAK
ncbi:hypothetical protein CUM91_06165 [Enterococcus faecalis]|uniref:hypothetical protein n=1 Tax=Enterococcus faecalis TaxID=1351 RepID=UPI000CF73C21|nr:hypothetical protein [Enterococcus faecalis]PQC14589.1 hypothetical protein CUM91_06165 [Enterococcus faecalis]